MQFHKIALLAIASTAAAQDVGDLLAELPADLASYAEGLVSNPSVVAAVENLIENSGVQAAFEALETAGTALNPTAFAVTLESAVQAAIATEPSGQRAILSSIYNVITADAATDGLFNSLGNIAAATGESSALSVASTAVAAATSSAAAGSSVTSAASSGATATSAASGSAASASVHSGAAPSSGVAMGGLVAAIAGVAAFL